jgi:hypothetical protein
MNQGSFLGFPPLQRSTDRGIRSGHRLAFGARAAGGGARGLRRASVREAPGLLAVAAAQCTCCLPPARPTSPMSRATNPRHGSHLSHPRYVPQRLRPHRYRGWGVRRRAAAHQLHAGARRLRLRHPGAHLAHREGERDRGVSWGAGCSLEPLGPLLTHLHCSTPFLWNILSAFLPALTTWVRGPLSPRRKFSFRPRRIRRARPHGLGTPGTQNRHTKQVFQDTNHSLSDF